MTARNGELLGRTALVTGGARGIGLAIATRLAQAGADVAILDIDVTSLEEGLAVLRQQLPTAEAVVADVTSSAQLDEAIATVEQRLGPIGILVNNAGVFVLKSMVEHTEAEFDRIVDTNLKGTFLTCRRVLPGMIERRQGHIVNIASVAAFNYTVPHAPYAASKAAIVALTRDLAFEVASHGISVNAVAPGFIERPQDNITTDGVDETRPLGWGRPEDIANAVNFLVSPHAKFIVGATLPVAGGTNLAVSLGFKRDEVVVQQPGIVPA
jgi:NAD(P)-dependent dehydrogenase (short-subunit alcohol dehydrogenase family)